MKSQSPIVCFILSLTAAVVLACGDKKEPRVEKPALEAAKPAQKPAEPKEPAAGNFGVTDTEIHIGSFGPQSGPAAPWGAVARGADALFKMINEEGGIHGRKIVYHMFDDAYNPTKTKAGVKELQEGVGIFAWTGGVGTSTGLAVKDYLMDREVPWVGPAAGSLDWVTPPQKYLFAVYPLYYVEAKALSRYAVDELGKKKVAVVYQNDDYGKNGLRGVKEELAKSEMELVAEIPVELADTDMKPHVMKLRESGADAVLLWVSPTHAIRVLGTAAAMKFAPQFMSTSTCGDFPLMYQISKGLWNGVISAFILEAPDSKSALMEKYRVAHRKFAAKDERWGMFFYAGIGLAEPLVEGLKRAGRDLTRESFVKAMESITDFKGIMGKVSFGPFDPKSPQTRQGTNQIAIAKCTGPDSYEKLTDWLDIDWP